MTIFYSLPVQKEVKRKMKNLVIMGLAGAMFMAGSSNSPVMNQNQFTTALQTQLQEQFQPINQQMQQAGQSLEEKEAVQTQNMQQTRMQFQRMFQPTPMQFQNQLQPTAVQMQFQSRMQRFLSR
jgi:cellobiose-specific phosphotransferase system component IIA